MPADGKVWQPYRIAPPKEVDDILTSAWAALQPGNTMWLYWDIYKTPGAKPLILYYFGKMKNFIEASYGKHDLKHVAAVVCKWNANLFDGDMQLFDGMPFVPSEDDFNPFDKGVMRSFVQAAVSDEDASWATPMMSLDFLQEDELQSLCVFAAEAGAYAAYKKYLPYTSTHHPYVLFKAVKNYLKSNSSTFLESAHDGGISMKDWWHFERFIDDFIGTYGNWAACAALGEFFGGRVTEEDVNAAEDIYIGRVHYFKGDPETYRSTVRAAKDTGTDEWTPPGSALVNMSDDERRKYALTFGFIFATLPYNPYNPGNGEGE